ncbi:unnamed protein product [Peronospora destructor]|uniref:Uncharacterized protein n=1 Tax=Peronospora destructor TaxID=86335 RepID=A0AAV0VDN9_9STRA|nr:unnamed protein product [Peronospora destructor]
MSRHNNETALDLFARRPTRSFLTKLSFIDAATTKTRRRRSWFSTTTSYRATRMAAIVARKLDGKQREEVVEEVLSRVQTCYCRDSFQWLATLNHVHFQLLEAPPAPLILVLNCVGSFHAIDKTVARSVGDGLALSEQVFVFLKQFIRHHSPIIFAAKDTTKNTRNPWEHTEYLPSSWTNQVSKRILLRIPPPLHAAPDLKLEKKVALTTKKARDSYGLRPSVSLLEGAECMSAAQMEI